MCDWMMWVKVSCRTEVVLLLVEELGREGGLGDVDQVLTELVGVRLGTHITRKESQRQACGHGSRCCVVIRLYS